MNKFNEHAIKYIIWGLVVLSGLIIAIYYFAIKEPHSPEEQSDVTTNSAIKSDILLIKSLPINIDTYDSSTGYAGDLLFTDQELQFNRIYFDYGYLIPASPDYPAKRNPQPTFLAPLGTLVHAITDGVVIDIPTLYSNDYSVMIAKDKDSNYIYELEHIINPTVKVGDVVKAGDIVGQVSDYDERNTPGLGLVEIGILHGGDVPTHLCPYKYLDPAYAKEITNTLKQLYIDWNEFKGIEVYDLDEYTTIGCLVVDEIEG